MTSDLTIEEKREAIGALLPGDSWSPAHEMALSWNRQVLEEYGEKPAPPEIPSKSSGSIRDAWVKLLGIHPSVNDQGALYHNREGLALLGYGYRIKQHTGRLRGDCKTEYRSEQVIKNIRLYVNGDERGQGQEIGYKVATDALFRAELDVSQITYVDRFDSETYCCKYKTVCGWFCSTYCVKYCKRCVLRGTETWHDRVTSEDSIEAKLYTHEPYVSLTPIEEYGDTVRAVLSPEKEVNTQLQVESKEYRFQGAVYSTELDESSPQTVTVTAQHLTQPEEETLLLSADSLCKLLVQDHFGTTTFPCSTEYTGTQLRLTTDRTFYRAGDSVVVSLEPQEELVELSYADQTYQAKGETILMAVPQHARITGRAIGQESSTIITVFNPAPWRTLLKILILILIVTATYSSIRQWARRRGLWDVA